MTTKAVAPSAEDEAVLRMTAESVLTVLSEVLGDRDFEVFESHFRYGMSIKDLAKLYEVEEASIRNRLARARRAIDGRLEAGTLGTERE